MSFLGGNRIFHSLQTLSSQLRVGVPNLPRDVFRCLIENDFMSPDGKLDLAVKTDVMVEKYFLKFDSLDRKPYGIRYLEKQYKSTSTPAEKPAEEKPAEKPAEPPVEPPKEKPVEPPPQETTELQDLEEASLEQEAESFKVWSSFGYQKTHSYAFFPLYYS